LQRYTIRRRHNGIVQDARHATPVRSTLFAEDALLSHTASDGIFLKKKILSVLSAINLQKILL
jgi:hypothetical protein